MNRMAVLVTGGAGYVGSHAVLKLVEAGYEVTVLDDLSTGSADSVIGADLVVGDIGDRALVTRLIRERRIETVMHFAAKTVVPESVADPLGYYDVNTSRTRDLLQCSVDNGVENFVFSSTAAVYGIPATGVASENTPTRPINPYGASKLMCERMLADVAAATDMRYVVLRYFNVAGSDTAGRIGQSKEHCTLLTKVACEAALGVREVLEVYGTDYDTPDGTGVRDYIHVEDIADAHIAALRHLQGGGRSLTLNCGYGHGYSVREVIAAVERVHGRPVPVRFRERRPGDPPVLIADVHRIRQLLDWRPRHDDLDEIVRSALEWEIELQRRRETLLPAATLRAGSGRVLHDR